MTNAERLIIKANAQTALRNLEHMTTSQFELGGDRPVREALAAILFLVGEPADSDKLRDYGDAVADAVDELHGFTRSPK